MATNHHIIMLPTSCLTCGSFYSFHPPILLLHLTSCPQSLSLFCFLCLITSMFCIEVPAISDMFPIYYVTHETKMWVGVTKKLCGWDKNPDFSYATSEYVCFDTHDLPSNSNISLLHLGKWQHLINKIWSQQTERQTGITCTHARTHLCSVSLPMWSIGFNKKGI